MSLHLWILRHGEAQPQAAGGDAGRALTERGRADAARAGAWLATHPMAPRRLLASPYLRAQQTAEQVRLALPQLRLETVDWLVPESQPLMTVKHLSPLLGPVLLVSHQPLAGAVVGALAEADPQAGPPLATAGLAELDVPMVALGFATLLSLRMAPDYGLDRA